MRIFLIFFFFLNLSWAEFLQPNEAFKLHSYADEVGVYFDFNIADTIYLYQKELKIKLDDKDITALLNLPASVKKNNEQRYYANLELFIPQILLKKELASKNEALLELSYQGCSEAGFCYRPLKKSFTLKQNQGIYALTELINTKNIKKQNEFNKDGFFLTLLSFFGYGLLLSLTPCTLPMIPILSSLILAKSTQAPSKKRAFWLSFIFVFFMSLAYALAGIATALLGASVQGFLQHPLVLGFFALIFVLLALACFGVFQLQMPSKIQNFIIKKQNSKTKGVLSLATMGFLSALIIGPCVVAPLAAALLYIAKSADIVLGGASLFVLSFGMGIPLLFVGLGLGFLKAGIWMQRVNVFFGFLMLAMAIWLCSRFLAMPYILIAFGVLGVFFVSFMGIFDRLDSNYAKAKKAILTLILAYSLSLFLGGLFGGKSLLNPFHLNFSASKLQALNSLEFENITNLNELEAKLQSKKPILLYFTASWCENCKLLDTFTFSDKRVQELLQNYALLKIDISKGDDEELKMMKKFEVFAPPVMFIFKDGIKREQIIGFVGADEFLNSL
ncbi:protein-disulfide reductase DsbD [Campylobacter sp. MIT 97-5078]|uniref:protein-disulfide reductase DsbD n=1 Tax=Campylobacter sp. MIT 97-5078 TaxID=1548153 RepID=UPI00051380F9|nr:protein-disulfide reductase DsbD [Campylobacter sp. MIT 97-5078]KGI56770.1 thiol:disulfide interchange protein [Campylobacter sp. MIT 97-5078]KGI57241.1 thiol:disulfide interchange protein [Campylobacter sp. MIT 97-5078]TQR27621.1 protein-disulfide reductase DsbD [Campylobacter sp. MIT 97-5078]